MAGGVLLGDSGAPGPAWGANEQGSAGRQSGSLEEELAPAVGVPKAGCPFMEPSTFEAQDLHSQ